MRLSIAISQAIQALRAYWAPSLWLGLAGTLALAAALPVLVGTAGLNAGSVPANNFGIEWTTLAVTPADAQQQAVDELRVLLMCLAVAVLAVAAVTLAALSVARAGARRGDVSVHRAVGATQQDIRIGALIEGLVLVGLALGIGVPTGLVGAGLARAAWPGAVEPSGGLGPALVAIAGVGGVILGGALFPFLSTGARRRPVVRSPAPHGLVVPALQLGISFAVLVAAAELQRTADRITATSTGPNVEGVVYEISTPGALPGERAARYGEVLDRLQADPRFAEVSLTSPGVLLGLGTEDVALTDCGRCFQGGIVHAVRATFESVSPDTFRILGLQLVAGRDFGRTDNWRAPRVAVISEGLAAAHFEDGHAVGRKIHLGRAGWYTVIGVVPDRRGVALGARLLSGYTVYVSALQQPPDVAELLLRPRVPRVANPSVAFPRGLTTGMQHVYVGDASAILAAHARPIQYFRRLIGFEGCAALVIAILGMFAMMGMWLRGALPELALRRAVGAKRGAIFRFVVVRAGAVAVGGLLAGLWVHITLSGFIEEIVESSPASLLTVAAGPTVLLALAVIVPGVLGARSVVRTSPVLSLDVWL